MLSGAAHLALLASGRHRLDRARPAVCRAGLLPARPLAAVVPRRWCSSRRSGRTSPSTGSTTSSGPPVRRCSSSAWRRSGPGWVFFRYRRRVASSGATLLAVAFGLWGLHHLDYPFLRARGAWAPWGYYLDILLALAVGAGILLLVLDDLRRGPERAVGAVGRSAARRPASRTCSPRCWRGRSRFPRSGAARSTSTRRVGPGSCGAPACATAPGAEEPRRVGRRGRLARALRDRPAAGHRRLA